MNFTIVNASLQLKLKNLKKSLSNLKNIILLYHSPFLRSRKSFTLAHHCSSIVCFFSIQDLYTLQQFPGIAIRSASWKFRKARTGKGWIARTVTESSIRATEWKSPSWNFGRACAPAAIRVDFSTLPLLNVGKPFWEGGRTCWRDFNVYLMQKQLWAARIVTFENALVRFS